MITQKLLETAVSKVCEFSAEESRVPSVQTCKNRNGAKEKHQTEKKQKKQEN